MADYLIKFKVFNLIGKSTTQARRFDSLSTCFVSLHFCSPLLFSYLIVLSFCSHACSLSFLKDMLPSFPVQF